MTGLALGHIRMLAPMTESTGEFLVFCLGLFHLLANFFVACYAEGSRCLQGVIDLQRMVGRMAPKTVAGHLALSMGFMTLGTIRNLSVYLMTEGTGLLGMGTFKINKILSRAFMAGKAGLFYIIAKIQGKRLMGVRMA